MALKDFWRGFWSTDLGAHDDSSGYNMTLIPPGFNASPPDINFSGGRPGSYRGYDVLFFQADLVNNSYANTSFTSPVGSPTEPAFGWCSFIYMTAFSGTQTIFNKRISGGTQSAEWDVQITSTGLFRFTLFGNTAGTISIRVTTTVAIPTNQYVHIAGDYDGTKTTAGMRLFVNGVQVATTPLTTGSYAGMLPSPAPLIFGASFSTLYTNFFTGVLDSIGVRASTFTLAELAELINGGAGLNPVAPALSDNWIVYWGSDTLSSDFAPDAPNQPQGVLNDGAPGTPTLVSTGGKPGRYHTMNGVNDNYNTRFGSGTGLMQFTDGAGNDQAFTATCWVNFSSIAVSQSLISKRDNTTGSVIFGWAITYSTAVGGFQFIMYGNAAGTIFIRGVAPIVPVVGQWYHIVATYDGSDSPLGMKIYIDGVQQVLTVTITGAYTGLISTSSIPVYIGMLKGTPSSNTLNGGIDGVGVRRGVSTEAQVTTLYNGGLGLTRDQIFGTIKDKWLAWYNFDNFTANDSSGNGNNLNVLSGIPLAGIAGKVGQSATISTTDYLGKTAPFPTFSFPNTQFCISFWIKPDTAASGTQEGIFAKGIGTNDREWFIAHSINIRARFFTLDASNYIGAITTGGPMINNDWQHIVIQKENNLAVGNIQIYHNGVFQSGNTQETAGTFGGMQSNNGEFDVGASVTPAVQRANGWYDMIGIRNQSLTVDQIQQLYNANAGLNLFPAGIKPTMIQFF